MHDTTTDAISRSASSSPVSGKVLIVNADDDTRSQLGMLLRDEGHVVETFSWAGALLDSALPEAPCCIIAQIGRPATDLPATDGLDLIERLHLRREPIPVIFVSDHADVSLSVRAIKAGAVDFLPRPVNEHDILAAVEHALRIDAERRRATRGQRALFERFDKVTPRERQVMDGVVRGLLNKQIAWELDISEITVKLHRSSLMRKMDLRSVPDLVRAAQALEAFSAFCKQTLRAT